MVLHFFWVLIPSTLCIDNTQPVTTCCFLSKEVTPWLKSKASHNATKVDDETHHVSSIALFLPFLCNDKTPVVFQKKKPSHDTAIIVDDKTHFSWPCRKGPPTCCAFPVPFLGRDWKCCFFPIPFPEADWKCCVFPVPFPGRNSSFPFPSSLPVPFPVPFADSLLGFFKESALQGTGKGTGKGTGRELEGNWERERELEKHSKFNHRPRKGIGKTQPLQSCLRKGVGKAQQLQSCLRKGNGRRPELNQQSARKDKISRNRKKQIWNSCPSHSLRSCWPPPPVP